MKRSWQIAVLAGAIFIIMIAVVVGFLTTEVGKKPIVAEKLQNRDYGYLYTFYATSDQSIDNRPYFGSPDAPITIIAYVDLDSDASRTFMRDIFPQLKKDYIDNGLVRYYPKFFLTVQDLEQKNERFIYVQYISCFLNQSKDYYGLYLGMFNLTGAGDLPALAERFNISFDDAKSCADNARFGYITEDMSEVENSGMSLNPRLYIGIEGKGNTIIDGIPPYRKLTRTIKEQQILLGE